MAKQKRKALVKRTLQYDDEQLFAVEVEGDATLEEVEEFIEEAFRDGKSQELDMRENNIEQVENGWRMESEWVDEFPPSKRDQAIVWAKEGDIRPITARAVAALLTVLDEAESHVEDRESGAKEGLYDKEDNPVDELKANIEQVKALLPALRNLARIFA